MTEGKDVTTSTPASPTTETAARFLWLDLTRKCQLECVHCYNESGPQGTHGTMMRQDWIDTLNQCVEAGVRSIQFIGGEPTMHPDLTTLVDHALSIGLRVEVYTNLVHVSDECWSLFQRKGVSLATSYYSSRAGDHNKVTGRSSHRRTRANIERAVGLGIPLRVGVIGTGENVVRARRELESVGVHRIGTDNIRPFGRGAQGQRSDPANLCGRCGTGRAAIGPTGNVSPCVFSEWMAVGNVHDARLVDILSSAAMVQAGVSIGSAVQGHAADPCYPDARPCFPAETPCQPEGYIPEGCSPDDVECEPGTPLSGCNPRR